MSHDANPLPLPRLSTTLIECYLCSGVTGMMSLVVHGSGQAYCMASVYSLTTSTTSSDIYTTIYVPVPDGRVASFVPCVDVWRHSMVGACR
ncbi:hypothetical protein T440DRAFT_121569 [Plenodomus tracheiphilus IPT5]|uniref:Uncharacterized protein n=1 Tax=Plenodomus tracheiphilus IPT5 TaxID=1408161 RepID=A0A6A7B396_9PLEO|nr:hypothetical protein T440DRAFT_121569 [Plenodomus tracheiphilus IPT5]